jgi:hypothetical protein
MVEILVGEGDAAQVAHPTPTSASVLTVAASDPGPAASTNVAPIAGSTTRQAHRETLSAEHDRQLEHVDVVVQAHWIG